MSSQVKTKQKGVNIRLPLISTSGEEVGELVSLTEERLSIDFCIKYCTWRDHNEDMFLTKFRNTPAKVKAWFEGVVFVDKTKQVFLVRTLSGDIIGVCGYCNLKRHVVELDTMIRGESSGHPELMMLAQRALIWLLFSQLNVQKIVGKVLSKNTLARFFHRQFGFCEVSRKPLLQKVRNDTLVYEVCQADQQIDEVLIQIALERHAYKSGVSPYFWPDEIK
jgi:hypothetical protein